MLYDSLQQEVFTRGAIDTTSSFITETMVRRWLGDANTWAAAYHKWPFTEYMDKSAAFTSSTETYAYPNTSFKTDSIRILKVGNTLFHKKNFNDYLQFREDYPTDDEELFSDFGRTLYINPNCATGTIYAYAQYTPVVIGTVAASTDSTVFSSYDAEGDDAVIEKTLSWVYKRKGDLKKAADYGDRAKLLLEEIWQRCKDEQFAYQTKDRQLFEDFDVLRGEDEGFNTLQF